MNKLFSKKPSKINWRAPVIILVVFLLGIIGFLGYQLRDMQRHNEATLWAHAYELGSIRNSAVQSQVALSPVENVVYIPEFRLKLPLNDTTAIMTYSLRTDAGAHTDMQEADVSTMELASYQRGMDEVIFCGSAVRIKFEAKPNPYNPNEKHAATATLADGRTLQAYASGHKSCQDTYMHTGVDPTAMATMFGQATSY